MQTIRHKPTIVMPLVCMIVMMALACCSAHDSPSFGPKPPQQSRIINETLNEETREALQVVECALRNLYPDTYDDWAAGNIGYTVEYYTRNLLSELRPGVEPGVDDTIMYIVNFANDRGFAFVTDSMQLLALTENGNITLSDFIIPKTDDYMTLNPVKGIVTELITNDLWTDRWECKCPFQYRDPPDSVVIRWEDVEKYGPYIHMKLKQGEPYNLYCFDSLGCRAKAGCVAIAITNVVSANRFPENSTYGWATVETEWQSYSTNGMLNYNAVRNNAKLNWLMTFIREVGGEVGMTYGERLSTTTNQKAKRFFANHGYNWVGIRSAEKVNYDEYLKNRKSLYISANASDTTGEEISKVGHAWALDGMGSFLQTRLEYRNGHITERKVLHSEWGLVHCNFGWGGMDDGYYNFGIFNTNKGPILQEADEFSFGNGNFEIDIKIIKYAL